MLHSDQTFHELHYSLFGNYFTHFLPPSTSIIYMSAVLTCTFTLPLLPLTSPTSFPSSFLISSQWVIERDERVRNAQAAFDANQKEIARLQAFVDRYVLFFELLAETIQRRALVDHSQALSAARDCAKRFAAGAEKLAATTTTLTLTKDA